MPDADRRNVVLVSIDSLRADSCGFMGADRDTTPRLDDLVTDGVVYESAVAPGPRTPSSMPVAFTGRFPESPAVETENWRTRRQQIALHLQRYGTLALSFAERGYATAGFTVNPWTTCDTRFDLGFDEFVQSPGDGDSWPLSVRALDTVVRATGNADRFNWHNKQDWLAQWPQFEQRIDRLADGLDEPYFLWVFLLDTHQPYIAPKPYRQENTWPEMYYAAFQYWNHLYRGDSDALPDPVARRLQRAYRDAVRSVDGFVGHLAESLAGTDPAIVVHSDHGEAFGDHGTYGHQQQLYEENLHVPLVAIDGKSAERVETPVSLRALPEVVSAVSRGSRYDPDGSFVTARTEGHSAVAVRGRRWKYVRSDDGDRLFDLHADPDERDNLVESDPDVATAFAELLGQYRRQHAERRAIGAAVETVEGEARL